MAIVDLEKMQHEKRVRHWLNKKDNGGGVDLNLRMASTGVVELVLKVIRRVLLHWHVLVEPIGEEGPTFQ